jgi:hypothetical protein
MNSERQHQIAFAERQFFVFQARVQLAIAEGKLDTARRFIENMQDCNDAIDQLRRGAVDWNNQPL